MNLINTYIKPIFRPIYNPIFDWYHRFRVDHFLRQEVEKSWLKFAGKPIDWNNLQTLNEKIQWLICFSDTTEWTRLADKLLVRDYVKQKGFEDILIPLVGTWKDARKIDFESLPEKCVLKCNHDCGSVVIIDKKMGYDRKSVRSFLNEKLSKKYGYVTVEPHYNSICPCILCEEFLDMDTGDLSSSPIDYKVFCYNGKPDSILITFNRKVKHLVLETRDINWNHRPEWGVAHGVYRKSLGVIPKPSSLERMLDVASSLSQGFPQVRVDFYDVKGKLYFGEMTFTSDCGRMPYFSEEYQKRAGSLIDLSLAKKIIS